MPTTFNPFTGTFDFTGESGISQAAADARYVLKTGDTMTGNLTIGDDHFLGVDGSIIFNETGADADFRVESDGDINNLFSDGGTNRVGIGSGAPEEKLHVIGNILVEDSQSATTKGYRFKTSGSDLDFDASGKPIYASVYSAAEFGGTQRFYTKFDSSGHNADAYGNWRFQDNIFGNALFSILPGSTPDEIVVNDAGIDADFRVETDNVTGAFQTDASNDAAYVMNSTTGKISFFGQTPAARVAAYTPTNVTTDRSYDADTVVVAELADVVGTLIADLKTYGLLQ
jgi:hypothetical protein